MPSFSCKRLIRSDLDDLHRTHLAIIENLPSKELFRDVDKSYLDRSIGPNAMNFGLFCDEIMIGYSALKLPSSGDQSNATHIGFSGQALSLVGEFDGSVVLPKYRGLGLQNALIEVKARASLLKGRPVTVATVSPLNFHSMLNVIRYGMTGKSHVLLYNNYPRFIFSRDHTAGTAVKWQSVQYCEFGNMDDAALLLARGNEIFDIVEDGGRRVYVFGTRQKTASAGIIKPLVECIDSCI